MPGIPPFILAILTIGKSTAQDRADSTSRVLVLLAKYDLRPCSFAADGAAVERGAQRIITDNAPDFMRLTISNSIPTLTLHLKSPIINGVPMTMTQDSKHAAKTARNQTMTGARILTTGDKCIHFGLILDVGLDPLGPLFQRDVERVDRQDDRAAARFFSAEMLAFVAKTQPGETALIVYLFCLGELFDAWQNRTIIHAERIRMVLRARLFLVTWRQHVVLHPKYSTHRQFISREAYDILLTNCDSLVLLVVTYRNLYPDHPFAPWLHTTEVSEHIFGMARQLKEDFTYADLLHMIPKLSHYLAGKFDELTPQEQANRTAAGYYHTHFKNDDVNIIALKTYPSDYEIESIYNTATQEATDLLYALNINCIHTWQSLSPIVTIANAEGATAGSGEEDEEDEGLVNETSEHEMSARDLIRQLEALPMGLPSQEERTEVLTFAVVAEELDKTLSM